MKKHIAAIVLLVICSYFLSAIKFQFPVDKKYMKNISSGQGLREMILMEETGVTMEGRWHNGIDIACPTGTNVYAAGSGIVRIVYPGKLNNGRIKWRGHPVYGSMVLIDHENGYYTLYAHLLGTLVTEGTFIEKGELIALSGGDKNSKPTGLSTNAHLHFAVYVKLSEVIDFE